MEDKTKERVKNLVTYGTVIAALITSGLVIANQFGDDYPVSRFIDSTMTKIRPSLAQTPSQEIMENEDIDLRFILDHYRERNYSLFSKKIRLDDGTTFDAKFIGEKDNDTLKAALDKGEIQLAENAYTPNADDRMFLWDSADGMKLLSFREFADNLLTANDHTMVLSYFNIDELNKVANINDLKTNVPNDEQEKSHGPFYAKYVKSPKNAIYH